MATLRAIAERRARVVERLSAARKELVELTGVECAEQPLTNRDANIAAIQQLENVADLLDALKTQLTTKAAPKSTAKTTKAAPKAK